MQTQTATYTPTLLRNGIFRLDAGNMFALLPKVVWSRWFPETGPGAIDDMNRMPLQQNSLLLEAPDGKLILFEVGLGNKTSEKDQRNFAQELGPDGSPRTIVDSLKEIDCDPKDISAVVLTHLHFDHAAALTCLPSDGNPNNPVLTFPNAEIYSQQQEVDDAIARRTTMRFTYLPSHMTPEVRERLKTYSGENEIMPGITCFPTPGHTWGQQAMRFIDPKGRTICYVGDIIPTHLHNRPTCNMGFDVEPYTSTLQRAALLERAHKENWILILNHEVGNPAVTPKPDPKRPGEFLLESTQL